MTNRVGNILFVVNYPANTGYAWDYFERLFARIGDRLAPKGVDTHVAYPEIASPPVTLEGSAARAVELDASLDTRESLRETMEFVRANDVRLVYYTDRHTWQWRYAMLRRAGVGHIVVADHTSGGRTRPRGLKRAAKWLLSRMPGITADTVVTPSDYVSERQREVNLTPAERIRRIYYGFPLNRELDGEYPTTHEAFGVDEDRPIVACACRAAPEKGVDHLLRSFDLVMAEADAFPARPLLVYCGDGPQFDELKKLTEGLTHDDDVLLAGYQPDAVPLLRDAEVFAIPSVWQDALPLSVMEPMSLGKPVVASRVGGIPEMVDDGRTGYLVEPGDEEELARSLTKLLRAPSRARRFGEEAREKVASKFDPERELNELLKVVKNGLGMAR